MPRCYKPAYFNVSQTKAAFACRVVVWNKVFKMVIKEFILRHRHICVMCSLGNSGPKFKITYRGSLKSCLKFDFYLDFTHNIMTEMNWCLKINKILRILNFVVNENVVCTFYLPSNMQRLKLISATFFMHLWLFD